MRKTKSIVVATALLIAAVAGWAASTPDARVAAGTDVGIGPLQIMMNTTRLPAEHYDDFSFVFN
jgi:hypothetical protein